jgi:hypothetical protein
MEALPGNRHDIPTIAISNLTKKKKKCRKNNQTSKVKTKKIRGGGISGKWKEKRDIYVGARRRCVLRAN